MRALPITSHSDFNEPGAIRTDVAASIVIIDDDAMLAADAAGLGLPDLQIQMASKLAELDLITRRSRLDAIVISLDLEGAFAALEKLCTTPGGPPVIAIASRGVGKVSLEHVLTIAELHGAATSLPKPIDASELALAAVEVMRKRRADDERLGVLAARLEKLALF